MSIKTQKILKYIPIVNLLVMFIWIGAYSRHISKPSRFNINLLKMFAGMIIINLPRIMANYLGAPEIIIELLFYVATYLSMLCIAHIAIIDQEKFLSEEKA